ncbi:MAG: Cys-Gln thioester bond-forming surface protein [Bacilli bacterium]|nr:Cys-Gln thioester bond-forming surface protein [Bacilli bacterium]
MKNKFIKIILFIILLIPFSNVNAATQNMVSTETRNFSSADVSTTYYIGYGNTYNFRRTYFHQISDGSGTYLAYCLDDGLKSPNNGNGYINSSDSSTIYNKAGSALDSRQLSILKNILAAGYQYSGSVYNLFNASSPTTKKTVLATQILVWEVMDGVRYDYGTSGYNSQSPNTYDFVKTDSELRSIYERILDTAYVLSGSNQPSAFGKTHVMHWNDGANRYTLSGVDIGVYSIDSYDTNKLSVTNNQGKISISSSNEISDSKINLKYVLGNTLSSSNDLKWFVFNNSSGRQKLLLAYYQGKATGSLSVKTESGKFKIIKKDSTTNKTLKGSVFKLYKCSTQSRCDSKETATVDMRNTDISSDITLKKSGLYLIKETTVPFGYEKINDFYVTFTINDTGGISATVDSSAKNVSKQTKNGTINLIIGNDAKYFNIKKVDGRNTNTQIKGTEFQIKKTDGTILKFNQVSDGKYRYDANGTVTSLKSNNLSIYQVALLPAGEYILEEKSVQYPYVLQGKQLERETKFRIDNTDFLQVYNYDSKKYVKSSDVTITVKNFKTRITIIKTGLKSAIVPGVTFELYDANKQNQIPVRYENGEYIYNSGSSPIQLITDSKGKIVINYLPEGTYYLKEVKTPDSSGLVIDPNNQFTQIQIYVNRNSATPYDYRKEIRNAKGTFCFYKIDEDGNYLDSGKFKLQMYNEKTSKYEDKALIFNEDKTYSIDETLKSNIYTFSPISDGQTCFVDINAKGNYRVVEIESPEGFVLPLSSEATAQISINEYGYAMGDALIINKKVKVGEGAEAQAELIINIQTGQNRIHYIIILTVILAIISGLIILKKKIDKK